MKKVESVNRRQENQTGPAARKEVNPVNLQAGTDLLQKAELTLDLLTAGDLTQLQRGVGNRVTGRILNRDLERKPIQRQLIDEKGASTVSSPENRTGLPDDLKAGLECLSGLDLAKVRVHHNSDRPFQIGALAYTQGMEIHIAPGQEEHLPHEAWHVVQQMEGRVRPTFRMNGIGLNDQPELEQEANLQSRRICNFSNAQRPLQRVVLPDWQQPVQRKVGFEFETEDILTQKKDLKAQYIPLEKNEVIKSFDGFDVTADEMDKTSDMEIKITEIDEDNPAELKKLLEITVPAVEETIDDIAAESCFPFINYWEPASNVWSFQECKNYFFHSNKETKSSVSGILQMTAGIQMQSLAGMTAEWANENNEKSNVGDSSFRNKLIQKYKATYAVWRIARYFAEENLSKTIGPDGLDLIASIVTLLSEIPIRAKIFANNPVNDKLPYPKASTVMMARTDFAAIIKLLPPEMIDGLSGCLIPLVINTINEVLIQIEEPLIANVKANDPVFPTGTFEEGVPDLTALTIGAWLKSMLPVCGSSGIDLLTKKNFPGGAAEKEWIESLGGFGSQLDPGAKPIFEFRGLNKIKASKLTKAIGILISYLRLGSKVKVGATN